jgi:hypothetical protein
MLLDWGSAVFKSYESIVESEPKVLIDHKRKKREENERKDRERKRLDRKFGVKVMTGVRWMKKKMGLSGLFSSFSIYFKRRVSFTRPFKTIYNLKVLLNDLGVFTRVLH